MKIPYIHTQLCIANNFPLSAYSLHSKPKMRSIVSGSAINRASHNYSRLNPTLAKALIKSVLKQGVCFRCETGGRDVMLPSASFRIKKQYRQLGVIRSGGRTEHSILLGYRSV